MSNPQLPFDIPEGVRSADELLREFDTHNLSSNDDTVEFCIYFDEFIDIIPLSDNLPPKDAHFKQSDEISVAMSGSDTFRRQIIDKCAKIRSFADSLEADYIWHMGNSFTIHPEISHSTQSIWSLRGSLTYGNCIEDEWFLTYILFEISV